MRTLYIDCSMGAAGDMLTAALLEIACAAEQFNNKMPGSDTKSSAPDTPSALATESGKSDTSDTSDTSAKSAASGMQSSTPATLSTENSRLDPSKLAAFLKKFHNAGIPGVEMKVTEETKQGIAGTKVSILVNGEEEAAPQTKDNPYVHGCSVHHDHDHNSHVQDHDLHIHIHGSDHDLHTHIHGSDDLAHDIHAHHHGHDEPDHHTDDSASRSHEHDHMHSHEHHVHRTMADIEAIINKLRIEESVKTDILTVYKMIAEAEGRVHGRPAGEVHFHEVGAMDAVADVTAVCMLMHDLKPDRIVASPVAAGYGSVRCAHGIMAVPAPATAVLLQGIPAYAGDVEGELCTPTGAALIKYFAQEYSQMPLMRTINTGYGFGSRNFEKVNCLRIFSGEDFQQAK